jgi:protein-tyrosine phosphatase
MRNTYFLLLILTIVGCQYQQEKEKNHIFQRHIELEGQSNFRDLGNYTTENGETLKSGKLYRSGTLSACSKSDVHILDSLGIKTVINFLTEEERKVRGEDVLPGGTKSVFLPISGENQEAKQVLEARQTGDFTAVPIELNYNIHALLVDVGKEAYKGFFDVLADADNYPVVFHCSHGVHRTGTATAILFMALDVPWDTIASEYMLSNTYRQEESNARIKALNELAESNPDVVDKAKNLENIQAFYLLNENYIQGTKEAIENEYGSIHNYLNSIGVDSAAIEKVKRNLLK